MNIILGSAQFGSDYGINNQKGKIPPREIFQILDYAFNHKIITIDTALNYGKSESIIGKYLKNNPKQTFKIITKLPFFTRENELHNLVKISLSRLNQKNLFGILIHDFKTLRSNPGIMEMVDKFKKAGIFKKIGVSVYYPDEIQWILKNKIKIDICQIPFNILDQRFAAVFSLLKHEQIEIHARSVFLQGLLFKNPQNLEKRFLKIKSKIFKLHLFAKKHRIPLSSLCINFVMLHPQIDKVLIGVDSLDNLKDNLRTEEFIRPVKKNFRELKALSEDDENIILPTKWKNK